MLSKLSRTKTVYIVGLVIMANLGPTAIARHLPFLPIRLERHYLLQRTVSALFLMLLEL